MRILWLALLHIASSRAQGYGSSWLDVPSHEAPAFQRPVDVLTDVINELGVRILQEYGETRNGGNVAFSPTGIGFILAALYEGSAGSGHEQIAHVLGLPRDRDVTRIGLRDIHRRLRSYLSPDGFLGGLTLNKENTKLRPDYEDILKFLGFDLPSGNDETNATKTEVTPATSGPNSCSPNEDSPEVTSTQESTSPMSETTVTSRITDDTTTTTQVPEEVTILDTSAEETTLKNEISDPTTTSKVVEVTEELPSTVEVTTVESATISRTTPVVTTTGSSTTVLEISSKLTEASSVIPPVDKSTEPVSSTEPTTIGTMVITEKLEVLETTLASTKETVETMEPETTTLKPEDSVSPETTTSVISEPSSTTESATTESPEDKEVLETSESESEVEGSTPSHEEGQEDSTTTSTEESSTPEAKETASNEIGYESTTMSVETTSTDLVDEVETIDVANATGSKSENLSSTENVKTDMETTTISSPPGIKRQERRRARRIGIRDPVIRTLLDAQSANLEIQVTARSDPVNSNQTGAVWINRVVEYSFTGPNTKTPTSPRSNEDSEDKDLDILSSSSNSQEVEVEGQARNRGTRSPRGYFSNFPELPVFPVYPDFPGYPEETSWTRKVGGWRVHSPKTDEGSEDSSELTFLVNGEEATVVSAATYTVVLPFAYLPTLQALALEFPLDDPRYNILLLLPTDRDGARRLAKDLGNVGLRELRKELQPAWVRAMIPSFMLKGFVTLTPFLQRLGIRDVFEPRDADLTPMTEEGGVYARDVQQSIGVNIRNYMKPDRTHSRNGLFERAGPVSFVAEHPFLFFIVDAETGVSLITGRIENPLNSRIL